MTDLDRADGFPSLRGQVTAYFAEKYGCEPEYLWQRYPGYAVFRHADNRKWIAVIMDIDPAKLGRKGGGAVDVINVKLDDLFLKGMLLRQDGYFDAYHMGRGKWVSILLDGTVPYDEICSWIDMSFEVTASAGKKQAIRPPKEWIVPANPKYYDIVHAFDERDEIEWKQGSGIRAGDTVFLYAAAPVSAILYRCRVTETGIPYDFSNGKLTIRALMRIRLTKRYDPGEYPFELLKREYGIFAVRGPRGVPHSLSSSLNRDE